MKKKKTKKNVFQNPKKKNRKKAESFSLRSLHSHCDSEAAPAWGKEDSSDETKISLPRPKSTEIGRNFYQLS